MGQKQEETQKSTLHLVAIVGEKDEKGRLPVTLKISRIEASVTGLTTNASIDTDTLDATKPLPAHQFVSEVALMRQPVQLIYEPDGRLVGVAGTDKLIGEIDSLLKKDFAGTPDVQFAGPSYLANAGEPAMKALWRDAFIQELPKDFALGKEWETTEDWPLAPFEMTTKTRYLARDAGSGALDIEDKIEVAPTQPKSIKLGPLDWTYSIQNGAGRDTRAIASDGWVRKSDSELELNLGGSFGIEGQSFPFDMNLKLKFHVQRVQSK
jgi:hypothetical protein